MSQFLKTCLEAGSRLDHNSRNDSFQTFTAKDTTFEYMLNNPLHAFSFMLFLTRRILPPDYNSQNPTEIK